MACIGLKNFFNFFLRKIFSIEWHFQNFFVYGPWSVGGGARKHREFPKHFFLRNVFSMLWLFQIFLVYGLGRGGGGLEHMVSLGHVCPYAFKPGKYRLF